MIETLALAILNDDRQAAGLPPVASRDSIPDSDGYVRNVRALLTALLDPTEEMIEAGWLESPARWSGCEDDLTPVWQAMIGALL